MAELTDLVSILSHPSGKAELVEAGVIDASVAAQMPDDVAGVDILSDEPTSDDAFGFHVLAKTLANIILSPATQTPLSIGLDGEWGTGKTSLLKMVERLVRVEQVPCLWLNAWSLESTETMITSLGSAIQDEIGKTGRLVNLVTKWLRKASYTVPGLGATFQVLDAVDDREEKVRELASVVTARRSFEELVQSLLSASKSERNRLVIFIDDLDRAMPEQVAAMLRHLKLILEARGCIFILAMDMKVVARSIETHYMTQHRSAEAAFGDRFLEKLLQIAVQIPPLTRTGVESYLDQLGIASEIQEIIRWAPSDEISNPRRLKRYLNWLSISLQLIRSLRLPRGVNNLTAVRLLALKRDWPEMFEGESGVIDLSSMSHLIDGDTERRAGFQEYINGIGELPFSAFDQFLKENPILSSGVKLRDASRGQGRKEGAERMEKPEAYFSQWYDKSWVHHPSKDPYSVHRHNLADAVEAGRQAYLEMVRKIDPPL